MSIGRQMHKFNMDISFTDEGLHQQQPQSFNRRVSLSILNKVCMHSLNFSNNMLQQIPIFKDKDNLQKLNISNNYITSLPLNLPNLKQLVASKNHIKNIPDDINKMSRLRIVILNSNQIKIVPFLKYVSHLYLGSNPIKLITSKISEMPLQQFQMDWVDFFSPIMKGQSFQSFLQIVKKIQSDKNCPSFIDFSQFFMAAKPMPRQVEILAMLWRSIVKQFNFFIHHIRNEIINNKNPYKQINFNDARHLGTSLLQYALQCKNQQAMVLFTQKKTNLNSPEILYQNIILACRYGHLQYFTYLIKNSLKKRHIFQPEKVFIEEALRNFNISNGSLQIIKIILTIIHQGQRTQYRLTPPQSYTSKQIDAIANGIYALLTESDISQYLDISQKGYQSQNQPLFHFAMYSRNLSLIQYMIKNQMNPFIPNIKLQTPRVIKSCGAGRKILWKYEKKLANKQFEQYIEKQSQINSFCVQEDMQRHNRDSIFVKLMRRRKRSKIANQIKQANSTQKEDQKCVTRLGGSAVKNKHSRQSSGQLIKWNSTAVSSNAKKDFKTNIQLSNKSQQQEQLKFQNLLQNYQTFQKLLLKDYNHDFSISMDETQSIRSFSSIIFCQDIQTCKQEAPNEIQAVGLITSRRRFHKL